eukprot:ANDGO_03973.mRNA.1 hypothetical protein
MNHNLLIVCRAWSEAFVPLYATLNRNSSNESKHTATSNGCEMDVFSYPSFEYALCGPMCARSNADAVFKPCTWIKTEKAKSVHIEFPQVPLSWAEIFMQVREMVLRSTASEGKLVDLVIFADDEFNQILECSSQNVSPSTVCHIIEAVEAARSRGGACFSQGMSDCWRGILPVKDFSHFLRFSELSELPRVSFAVSRDLVPFEETVYSTYQSPKVSVSWDSRFVLSDEILFLKVRSSHYRTIEQTASFIPIDDPRKPRLVIDWHAVISLNRLPFWAYSGVSIDLLTLEPESAFGELVRSDRFRNQFLVGRTLFQPLPKLQNAGQAASVLGVPGELNAVFSIASFFVAFPSPSATSVKILVFNPLFLQKRFLSLKSNVLPFVRSMGDFWSVSNCCGPSSTSDPVGLKGRFETNILKSSADPEVQIVLPPRILGSKRLPLPFSFHQDPFMSLDDPLTTADSVTFKKESEETDSADIPVVLFRMDCLKRASCFGKRADVANMPKRRKITLSTMEPLTGSDARASFPLDSARPAGTLGKRSLLMRDAVLSASAEDGGYISGKRKANAAVFRPNSSGAGTVGQTAGVDSKSDCPPPPSSAVVNEAERNRASLQKAVRQRIDAIADPHLRDNLLTEYLSPLVQAAEIAARGMYGMQWETKTIPPVDLISSVNRAVEYRGLFMDTASPLFAAFDASRVGHISNSPITPSALMSSMSSFPRSHAPQKRILFSPFHGSTLDDDSNVDAASESSRG